MVGGVNYASVEGEENMINRTILTGRLCADPELKYTQNGIANTRFTLAVNRAFSNQNGERQADFINCVAWKKQAENMAKFLRKGSLIGLEGRIETGSYQAQDGTTRYTTDVIADSVQFLESKNEPQGAQSLAEARQQVSQQNQNTYGNNGSILVKDDDLPF